MKSDSYDSSDSNGRSKDSEDYAELRSLSSRNRARSQLTEDVEAFLAQGGAINEIEPDVMADPPRKPQPKYGSRPI